MRRRIPVIFQRPDVPTSHPPNLFELFPETSELPFRSESFEVPLESSMIRARTSVLNTVELLETIFQHCTQADLIVNIQRVCRKWHAVAVTMPQTFLDKVPPLDLAVSSLRQPNPLLRWHFSALYKANEASGPLFMHLFRLCTEKYSYKKQYWQQPREGEFKLSQMGIALHESSSAKHRAFANPNASWRKMQLCTPPITTLVYRRDGDGDKDAQKVSFPDGLRMGDLYDLAIEGIVCDLSSKSYGKLKLVWWSEGLGKVAYQKYRDNTTVYESDDSSYNTNYSTLPKSDPRRHTLFVIKATGLYNQPPRIRKPDFRLESSMRVLRTRLMCRKEPLTEYIVTL